MRANIDRAAGVRLVTDPVGGVATSVAPVDNVVEHLDFETDVPEIQVVALCGRQNSGLSVQLLTTVGADVRAWITLDVNGQTETFEVEPSTALDAYQHPYAYGATLPL